MTESSSSLPKTILNAPSDLESIQIDSIIKGIKAKYDKETIGKMTS